MNLRTLLLTASLVALPAAAAPPGAPPSPSRGDRGVALTVVEGRRIERVPVVFLGTYPDFAGPGYDLHLVRLEGPIADRVGVAAGMSGSPVFFDDRLLGALSYRLGTLPTEPVAGVTPIGDMLAAARRPAGPAPRTGTAAPIATPLTVSGLAPSVRDWLAERIEPLGMVLAPGGGEVDDVDSAAARPATGVLEPGSPFGVELMRGDVRVAATGTVTWVDGERVYGFGHPFLGGGRVEFPLVSAEVIHTLGDLAGSLKLASVGRELGVIDEDRLSAVVGRTTGAPRMIPLRAHVHGGSYGAHELGVEMIDDRLLTPLLGATALANALLGDQGFEQRSTMRLQGTIRLAGGGELPLEAAFAGESGGGAGLQLAGWLQQTMLALWRSPYGAPGVEGIDLDIEARAELVRYRLERLHYDRGPLGAGGELRVRCRLRPDRGEPIERELTLQLPADLQDGERLALAVGPPEQIDVALGRPLQRRLTTARTADGLVEALGARRAADRLVAVIYRRAAGVVTGGQAYTDLPPTAERLLGRGLRAGDAERLIVAPLASAEIRLDGPVEGGLVVRLRYDAELDGSVEEEPEP